MSDRQAVVLYLLLTLGFLVVYAGFPEIFLTLVQEDHVVEWGTFAGYMAAAGLFLVAFLRARLGGPSEWFLGFVALGCFLVAGEEVSWGQRILGFGTPEAIAERNYQNEFNFHNLGEWGRDTPRRLYIAGVFGYLLIYPLVVRYSSTAAGLARRWRILVPPAVLLVPFGCSLVLPAFTKISGEMGWDLPLRPDYVVEVTELFSAFVFLHFGLLLRRESYSSDSFVPSP